MAKKRLKIHFRIPEYSSPRYQWRRSIYNAALEQAQANRVKYTESDRLEVVISLYLSGRALDIHDVDNRAKDILDALQGRFGGSKSIRTVSPIIPNDRQVYRLIIEKLTPPKQSLGMGHVTVRKFSNSGRGLRYK